MPELNNYELGESIDKHVTSQRCSIERHSIALAESTADLIREIAQLAVPMQTQKAELRMMLKRLLARLDTTPDPYEMVKLQGTIKELERKIRDLER